MKRFTPNTLLILLTIVVVNIAFAAHGGFIRKEKNRIRINITPSNTLKNSIRFNLKSGLVYKGSQMISLPGMESNNLSNVLVTYQKGNTVYIVPYKQKALTPEFNGSNYKLIFRPK